MAATTTLDAVRGWAHLTVVLGARMYRVFLLGLVVIAAAPPLFGWGSYVVESGSMEPSLHVGDVVIASPYTEDQRIRVGRVFVFDDPATTEPHLMVHRIVERRDDGKYTTAGDANAVTDITPLPSSDVRATAVLLAPRVGHPVTWAQSGQWLRLAAWLLATIGAFAFAVRHLEGESPRRGLRRRRPPGGPPPDDAGDHDASNGARRGGRSDAARAQAHTLARTLRVRPPVATLAALLLAGMLACTANAGFTGYTRNSAMSWTVGQWTQPYVTAVLADSPHTLWLLDEQAGTTTAQDRSGNQSLGSYRPAAVLGQQGGLPNNPGSSITTSGGLALTGSYPTATAASHTVELWFRTGTQAGGSLAGFGSSTTTGTPSYEDRVVRMTTTGHITYGDWANGSLNVVTTPGGYADNTWHHLVVVSTSANGGRENTVIYVDGAARVSGLTSKVEYFSGYVRVGGGSGTSAFSGSIDNVSVYDSALPAQRVAAHYAAR